MTFQEDSRKRFERRLQQLHNLLRKDAPEIILARCFVLLSDAAEGAFGKELSEVTYQRRQEILRERAAYCKLCENTIRIQDSHIPCCDECIADLDEEFGDVSEEEYHDDV